MNTYTLLGLFLIALFFPSKKESATLEAHKYYVSVTRVDHKAESDALQITSRIFIDDLDLLLNERYDLKSQLDSPNENPLAEEYIQKYLKAKFLIRIDGEVIPYKYLGKRYESDQIVLYMEVENSGLSKAKNIAVECSYLTDLYAEQKNILHLVGRGKKKSFVLIKENNKGMLNFP